MVEQHFLDKPFFGLFIFQFSVYRIPSNLRMTNFQQKLSVKDFMNNLFENEAVIQLSITC